MKDLKNYAPFVLRLGVGGTFFVAGVLKLLDTNMAIGMLRSINFPLPSIMGIVLMLTEIIFGLAVLLGYKLKYTIWPLKIILIVAMIGVHIPGIQNGQPMSEIMLLFHFMAFSALISLFMSGPGALAFSGEEKKITNNKI